MAYSIIALISIPFVIVPLLIWMFVAIIKDTKTNSVLRESNDFERAMKRLEQISDEFFDWMDTEDFKTPYKEREVLGKGDLKDDGQT